MNRKGFLRSIVMVAAAPDIISQLEFKPPIIPNTVSLFNQLNFVVPDYMPKLIEKYGNTSWASFHDEMRLLEEDKKLNPKVYNYECDIV